MKRLKFLKTQLALLLLAGVVSYGGEERLEPAAQNPKGSETAKGATPVPGQIWRSPTTGMEFVKIKPGTFLMGSPDTEEGHYEDEIQHRVTLTMGYWLGKYEVTQGQWKAVMGSHPSVSRGDDFPVEQVSWEHCQAFIKKLCELEGVPEGTYRLPTEAEWEYACRAGTDGPYAGNLDYMAWYDVGRLRGRHPVGQKKPNAWGLYDMHGNVAEWCADWIGDYPSGEVTDPTGPDLGSVRVIRGGSWMSHPWFCRSAYRSRFVPGGRASNLGFRLLKTE